MKIVTLEDALRLVPADSERPWVSLFDQPDENDASSIKLDQTQVSRLMEMLSGSAQRQKTFGSLFQEKLVSTNTDLDSLPDRLKISIETLYLLIEDRIQVTTIPLRLFKKLINVMEMTFDEVQISVRNSFEAIDESDLLDNPQMQGLSFRTSSSSSNKRLKRTSSQGKNPEVTEASVDRFLNRLKELNDHE